MKKSSELIFSSEQIKLQLADSSKALAYLTANMVFDNPAILKSLLEVTWQDQEPWAQRASRIVSICCCRFPELLKPYVSFVLAKMGKVKSEGTRRNLLKIFMEVPVPLNQKEKARLLNLCFDHLTGSYSVSVKVYSMDVLYKPKSGRA